MNALCRTLAVAILLLPACVQGQPADRAKAESLLRSMRQADSHLGPIHEARGNRDAC